MNTEMGIEDFEREQSGALRRRMRWALAFALALWGFAFLFADDFLYGSREGKLGTRVFQLVWAGGTLLWLLRERSRTAMEVVLLSGGGVVMVLSALSLRDLGPDQLVFAVISRLFGVYFIVHLLQLRWPAALAAYAIASATMLGGYADNQIDGVHRIGLASMWVLAPVAILTYGAHVRETRQREAFRLRRELVEANERLAAEVGNRTRLFLGLSHDLRTPLSVVRGEAERLPSMDDAVARGDAVWRITEQVDYATDLIDQLLELARLDEGHAQGQPRPLRLDRALRELVAQLSPPTGAVIAVTGPPVSVVAEPRHVRRILTNIVGNALRHIDPVTGRVDIAVHADAGSSAVEVEVRDNGPGIDASRAPKLFHRFATMDPDGTVLSGVGLPLARELAELNGGALELRSARPAVFVLTLRRSNEADAESEAVASPNGASPATAPRIGSRSTPPPTGGCAARADAPRVLVVEDHAALAALLVEQLGSELRVSVATTLAEAREAMRDERFDVVLADMGLPDGSGLDLLGELRELHGARPAFIVLSALGDPETRARTIAAGADDHIVKPYTASELRARIERALRQIRERESALEKQRDEVVAEIHDGVGGALARALAILGPVAKQVVRPGFGSAALDDPPPTWKAPGLPASSRSRPARLLAQSADLCRDRPLRAPPDAHAALAELRSASEELRDGLRLLSERDCAWRSVTADLRFALATIAETHGIAFEGDCGDSRVTLRPVVAHTLRRIATEAMTNVVKHAGAQAVRFSLACDGAMIRMELRDDGRGMPGGRVEGLGLGIMAARAARLGGVLEVRSREDAPGVSVSLRLPCEACRSCCA